MTQDLFAPKFSLSYLLGTRPGLAAEHAADRLLAVAAPVATRRSGILTRAVGRSVALGLIALAVVGGPGLSLLRDSDPTIAAAVPPTVLHSTTPRLTDDRASRGVARTPVQVQTRVVEVATFRQAGVATWYGPGFHGRRTANGETFNSGAMTAAHRTLPFGTKLRVCTTAKCVVVRVNDRGPFGAGRILDLSRAAAEELGTQRSGIARVRISVLTERLETTAPVAARGPQAPTEHDLTALPAASGGPVSASLVLGLVLVLAVLGGSSLLARRAMPAFAS